jgi:hypothetical protein
MIGLKRNKYPAATAKFPTEMWAAAVLFKKISKTQNF